tara:strand:+ start:228 stop:494 length:267 start_codon:yes stop_codon:yes gene_type:complete
MSAKNLNDVLVRMHKLLHLRTQVSMDGVEYIKRNAILDEQRDIVKAHNELSTLTREHAKYKEALEDLLPLSVEEGESHEIIRKALENV